MYKSKKTKLVQVPVDKLDVFSAMAMRAANSKKMRKGLKQGQGVPKAITVAERLYVQKMARAHKGSRTLFTRNCRPEVECINDAFYGEKMRMALELLAPQIGVCDPSSLRWAKPEREHQCFSPFHAMERPSLHDGEIVEWDMRSGQLCIVFEGYYCDASDDMRFLEVRFADPKIEILLRGIDAKLSPRALTGHFLREAGWTKANEPKKAQREFAGYERSGVKCSQGFDQLRWIHSEERSLQGEPLSWKILFGSNAGRGMELSIGFASLEFTHGQASIKARREALSQAEAIQAGLPEKTKAAQSAKPRI